MVGGFRLFAFLFIAQCLFASSVFASVRVLVLGDSISAAYGIDKSEGWVALLQTRLDSQCSSAEGVGIQNSGGQAPDIKVMNASVSGETTHGGKVRLPDLLSEHKPRLVIIELGGNDGLRGLSPVVMQKNLASMIELSHKVGAKVVLLGILIPPNYGIVYQTLFEQAIANVAESTQVPFVKFFLEGIGGRAELMQDDGVHPTAAAQVILLDNAWVALAEPLQTFCEPSFTQP